LWQFFHERNKGKIMRKYIWFAVVLSMAMAVGVYWGARQLVQGPGSTVTTYITAMRQGSGHSVTGAKTAVSHASHAKNHPYTDVEECFQRAQCLGSNVSPETRNSTPAAVEPAEVITIENIDPQVAKAIADALEVGQRLQNVSGQVQSTAADNGPDQVVLTILDADPAPLPASGSRCRRPATMPYCGDSDMIGTADLEDLIAKIWERDPISEGTTEKTDLVMPNVTEHTNLVMPYVDDEDETAEQPDSQDTGTANDSNSENPPTPDGAALPHDKDQDYHRGEMHCPYLNGGYCPRYSTPYQPPVVQPETMPMNPDATEAEERKEDKQN
jgi:hypothetical protein